MIAPMRSLATALALLLCPLAAIGHTLYLANDDHTDYGWNDTTDAYDAAMLSELDYYLDQVDATAGDAEIEQARFSADCWWYLRLYEDNRSDEDFSRLIDAMRSGHVTVPLNPFVTLYGVLPTEAAIRAGYYPGRVERAHGVSFRIGLDMENTTIPWGLASIWPGSGAPYSWKGICACAEIAPWEDRTEEVFQWEGPDGQTVLMKWYQIHNNASWGGYAEARNHLNQGGLQEIFDAFDGRAPGLPITGIFGGGWDDVEYTTDEFVQVAAEWNVSHPDDPVVVSNEVDYFEALEAHRDELATLRGSWGNEWDLWPLSMAEHTSSLRRAMERLRAAESLATLAAWADPAAWPAWQRSLDAAFVSYWMYVEHTWGRAGAVTLESVRDHKLAWAADTADRVDGVLAEAGAAVGALFETPADETRFAAWNPLGFARDEVLDLPVAWTGNERVVDVATGEELPSQAFGGALRVLVRAVPALGYRVLRVDSGVAPAAIPAAATVDERTLESERYRVTLSSAGAVESLVDRAHGDREAVRRVNGHSFNDLGAPDGAVFDALDVGPVSATLRATLAGSPAREVRVTLFAGLDRVEIDDRILENTSSPQYVRFGFEVEGAQLRFEEVGAIARPGMVAEGGDFQPGARVDLVTLNHFVDASNDDHGVTLSSADGWAMRFADSTPTDFDLSDPAVSIAWIDNPASAEIREQGGATSFAQRYAVRPHDGGWDGPSAMRMALAHQNPLVAIALPAGQAGPLTQPTWSLVSVSPDNVLVWALKPAEEGGERGVVLRLWELAGEETTATIDLLPFRPLAAHATSLIETDRQELVLDGARVTRTLAPQALDTIRFVPSELDGELPPPGDGDADADADGDGDGDADGGADGDGDGDGDAGGDVTADGGCCRVAGTGARPGGVVLGALLVLLALARRRH